MVTITITITNHHQFNITISTESAGPNSSKSVIGHIATNTMADVIHTNTSKRIAITKISRISH